MINPNAAAVISIPYGSIKSTIEIAIFLLLSQFQFLMVQLKEATEITMQIVHNYFNSLWFN